jgi:hypothetical protein
MPHAKPIRIQFFLFMILCVCATSLLVPEASALDGNLKKAQQLLTDKGYQPGTPDGIFGSKTELALKQYQKDNGLPQTGVIDEATAKALGVDVHVPVKREKYAPINPKELYCTVKFEEMMVLSGAKGQHELVGSVKQLKCEGKDIELADPKLKNEFITTKKYGKFKITLHPKADAWHPAINIHVTPSQRKELLKLKNSK